MHAAAGRALTSPESAPMLRSVPASALEGLVAAWWGFAEADRSVLGLVVVVLGALAVAYLVIRRGRGRGTRRRRT
jgi:hypothetical protein